MEIHTSIGVQAFMVSLALVVVLLRMWARLRIEQRAIAAPEYFIWLGWFFATGWFICSIKALKLGEVYPLDENAVTESEEYLKVVFVGAWLFDLGLYLPKISIVIFYWWLIPRGFKRLRIALYISTAYLGCALLATVLGDTLICRPFSDNWSLENQLKSLWNSYPSFVLNWVLNISTDVILFCLPFFILNCLKLHRRQKIGLTAVFSLGMITIIVSCARFITYIATDFTVEDVDGNAWCTIELCTGIIVVSLPGLKSLIVKSGSPQPSKPSTTGYIQTFSGQHGSSRAFASSRVRSEGAGLDDELELVHYDHKPSLTPTRTTDAGSTDAKEGVMVTTDVMVTRST